MKTRPSSLLDIQDPYVAYCLDDALVHFGQSVEGALAQVEHKNTELQSQLRLNKLNQILGEKPQFAVPKATKRLQ